MGSYAIFLLLGTAAMITPEKKRIGWRWIAVPGYWMMVSVAAWHAVIELRSNPFHWHKTPHRPSLPDGSWEQGKAPRSRQTTHLPESRSDILRTSAPGSHPPGR